MCRVVSKLFGGMLSKLEFRVIVRIVPGRYVQSWHLFQVHVSWRDLRFHEYQTRENHKQNRGTHFGKKKCTTPNSVGALLSHSDIGGFWTIQRDLPWIYTTLSCMRLLRLQLLSPTNEIWHKCMWNLGFFYLRFQILSHLHNSTLYNNIDALLIV